MHKRDYKRAQSIMKIHGKRQVYFYEGKIFLKKADAPAKAEKIIKEIENE